MKLQPALLSVLISLSSIFSQSTKPIVLSEIMFNPGAANSEFIELYNNSENPVDLTNLKIAYHTSSPDLIVAAADNVFLAPKQFALILEKDYEFESGIYSGLIPDSILVLTTTDNSFGSNGMANSSDRAIRLILNGDTLETHTYSADNDAGYSDEKMLSADLNSNPVWLNSTNYNGTPGFKNSCEPKFYDLEVFLKKPNVSNISTKTPVTIEYNVTNIGLSSAVNISLVFYRDKNFDNIAQPEEKMIQKSISKLESGFSVSDKVNIGCLPAGKNKLILEALFEKDENPINNFDFLDLFVLEPACNFNDIIINEIMYAPGSGQPEWIELYNRSEKIVNIKNWGLNDRTTSVKIIADDLQISPGEYLLISDEESIHEYFDIETKVIVLNLPSLNNSGDEIVIKDSLLVTIDSLDYTNFVNGSITGLSLERISPDTQTTNVENWKFSNSPDKATPGKINSVSKKEFDLKIIEIKINKPNPLYGETVLLNCKIKNTGKNSVDFKLFLYEITENTFTKLEESSTKTLLTEDSLYHVFSHNILINDIKLFYVEILCEQDNYPFDNIDTLTLFPGYLQNSLLINEIMFSPDNEEPEWVELYNPVNYPVNIIDWSISDILSTPVTSTITKLKTQITPGEYLVIAKDSMIFNYHPLIPATVILSNFANLNNSLDGVVIKDIYNQTIDSAFYSQSNFKAGYSIERIDLNKPAVNSLNWHISFDEEKSTPGRENSKKPPVYDLKIDSLFISPENPYINDRIYFNAIISNAGEDSVKQSFAVLKVFMGADSLVSEFEIKNFIPGEKLEHTFDLKIIITDNLIATLEIKCDNDDNPLDNFKSINVKPFSIQGSIIINEIMFNPCSGAPEWIELKNISDNIINLSGWCFCDLYPSKKSTTITGNDFYINPDEYLILSSFLPVNNFSKPYKIKILPLPEISLNNTEDSFLILDPGLNMIDSVYYNDNFNCEKGFSIERLSSQENSCDPNNWGISINPDGSTPGGKNSVCNILEYQSDDLIINEIMFDPASENTEFIELFNPENYDVDIGGWTITESSKQFFNVSRFSFLISPDEYYIIAADSSIFNYYNFNSNNIFITGTSSLGLSNTEDWVTVTDYFGNVIDSIYYKSDWHNSKFSTSKNRSLEKINPLIDGNSGDNWSSSVNKKGATPGERNSVSIEQNISSSKFSISPNPFSPDNDGFEDFTLINYSLDQPVVQLRVRIFDNRGRLVRTLENLAPAGPSGSIIFDGKNKNGNYLRIGIYILLLEAYDERNKSIAVFKSPFVVARKL